MPMRFIWKIEHATMRMLVMVIGSILAWATMAVIMRFMIVGIISKVPIHYPALAAFGIQVFVAMFVTVFGDRYSAKGEGKVTWKLYAFASVLGLITGVGLVFLSKADDTSGGLLMAFPIILIASLSSLASTYQETLPITAITAMIGGSVSTSLYAIIFAESLPMFDALFQKRTATTNFKPASVAIATIICWFSCLIFISLPVLFILRCLARREKSAIEKVTWRHSQDGIAARNSHSALTADWETFGLDDDEEDDDMHEESRLLRSTSGMSPSLDRTTDSFSHNSLHSDIPIDAAARRALLEESALDESPLFISSAAGVDMPESPVPPGSSRLISFPNSVSILSPSSRRELRN